MTLHTLFDTERARISAINDELGDYLRPVFGEGPGNAPLMLIGEAPGGEEAAAGRPFVGKAGKQLDSLLAAAGLKRDEVYITNAVKYRPVKPGKRGSVNRTPTTREIDAARVTLRAELEIIRPSVIATLGNSPLYAAGSILGLGRLTVGEAHGRPIKADCAWGTVALFPLYHPASGIYNKALIPVMEHDIRELGRYIGGLTE